MTDKITVELDRELAEKFIKRTACYDGPFALVRNLLQAALPPEWEEGTVAILKIDGLRSRVFGEFRNGSWCAGPDSDLRFPNVLNVEPIRVLKDDEVAVKRASISTLTPDDLRKSAKDIDKSNWVMSARVLLAYADALEAEK